MKVTKYTLNRKLTVAAIGLLAVGWGTAILVSPDPHITDPFPLFAVTFLVIVYVDMLFGIYCLLDPSKGTLKRVDHFVIQKELSIRDIAMVRYQPTWVGGRSRSLYISDTSGKHIEMSAVGFGEPALAQLVGELKRAYPYVRFDEHSEALNKEYEGSRR